MKKRVIVQIALCSVQLLHCAQWKATSEKKEKIKIPNDSYLKVLVFVKNSNNIALQDKNSSSVKISSKGKFSVLRLETDPEGRWEEEGNATDTVVISVLDNKNTCKISLPATYCFCKINGKLSSPVTRKKDFPSAVFPEDE